MASMLRIGAMILCLAFVLHDARAQETIDDLLSALASGEAEAVLVSAEDRVEMALMGQGRLFNGRQAVYVLKEFFRRYPPESLAKENEMKDAANWFATARYTSTQGDNALRVYVSMQLSEDRWRLTALNVTPFADS